MQIPKLLIWGMRHLGMLRNIEAIAWADIPPIDADPRTIQDRCYEMKNEARLTLRMSLSPKRRDPSSRP